MHRVLQRAGDAAGDHVGAAKIGLGKGNDDRAVIFAAGEIDIAGQPRQQPRAVHAGAPVERAVE